MTVAASNVGVAATRNVLGMPVTSYQDPLTKANVPAYPYLGEPGASPLWQDSAVLKGTDVLLSDVLSFEVKILQRNPTGDFVPLLPPIAGSGTLPNFTNSNSQFDSLIGPMVFDTWASGTERSSGAGNGYDFTGWNTPVAPPTVSTAAPLQIVIGAVKVTIRIWDAKTLQARQITIIQDM
jgi:hypothetical protein